MRSETSQEIDLAAAAWVARIDRGSLLPMEEARLQAWIAGDIRRRGAFVRLRAISVHTERAAALGPNFNPDDFVDGQPDHGIAAASSITRRRALWLGGSAVAAAAAGAVGLRVFLGAARYNTRVGEMKVVTLADGSVMTLNTKTRASVQFDSARRLVSLEDGEALFDVAKNSAQPFIVQAGDTSVRAVGTSFTVKHLENRPIEVLVREGVVELTAPDTPRPLRLTANTRIVATPDQRDSGQIATVISSDDLDRELAWQSGRIAMEGETLDQAAAEFGRYSDVKIAFADPSIGREEISGLFTANDPVSFARAAAASLDLKANVGEQQVTLSR